MLEMYSEYSRDLLFSNDAASSILLKLEIKAIFPTATAAL